MSLSGLTAELAQREELAAPVAAGVQGGLAEAIGLEAVRIQRRDDGGAAEEFVGWRRKHRSVFCSLP